jgi:hypothetical protein
LENLKGRDHSEEVSVDERITSEWILRKQGGKMLTGFICNGIGPRGRLL